MLFYISSFIFLEQSNSFLIDLTKFVRISCKIVYRPEHKGWGCVLFKTEEAMRTALKEAQLPSNDIIIRRSTYRGIIV